MTESPILAEIFTPSLAIRIEQHRLRKPFRITGLTWSAIEVVKATLQLQGCQGIGEAAGVYYRGETANLLARQLESVAAEVRRGISHGSLLRLLPAGGARNALDCALWDLQAKIHRAPVWSLLGIDPPRPLLTTFTCGAASAAEMAEAAAGFGQARALKLKLTGEALDADRVRAVRVARPDVWLGVDANQGFDRAHLSNLMEALVESDVRLIEQPFPVGAEGSLAKLESPIPIAADESVQDESDLSTVAGLVQVVNIKLDKCGGLTAALALVRSIKSLGMQPMVGCMASSSLSLAPAFLVGQSCSIVDLDSALFLERDCAPGCGFAGGRIQCDEAVWGGSDMPDSPRRPG